MKSFDDWFMNTELYTCGTLDDEGKYRIINEILDLMLRSEISIRDLAAVLENTSLDACVPDMHEKIKGYLYCNRDYVKPGL